MQVRAKIKDIVTINTDKEGMRENQPLVEFTLQLLRPESEEPEAPDVETELKFSEMLSTLAGMSLQEITDLLTALVKDYVGTAFKGQAELTPAGEWLNKDTFMNAEFTVEV